jgi:hypothetical protein
MLEISAYICVFWFDNSWGLLKYINAGHTVIHLDVEEHFPLSPISLFSLVYLLFKVSVFRTAEQSTGIEINQIIITKLNNIFINELHIDVL